MSAPPDLHERLAAFRARREAALRAGEPAEPGRGVSEGLAAGPPHSPGTRPGDESAGPDALSAPVREVVPAAPGWQAVAPGAVAILHDGMAVSIRWERTLPDPRPGGREDAAGGVPLPRLAPGWRPSADGPVGAQEAPPPTLPPEAVAWFDLETTGLSAGAGTRAFLAGILREAGADSLLLVQHVLPDLDRTPGFLAEVDRDLAGAGWITFNGRSFDLPLWNDLHVLSGLAAPARPGDLDLLPPARAVWGSRVGRVSLDELGRAVLGDAGASGDPGGAAMPGLYMAYLGSGSPSWMGPALAHNAGDLVRLHGLSRLLDEALATPPAGWPAEDLLGLARLAERWNLSPDPALEASLLAASSPAARARARSARAFRRKRLGRHELAAEDWRAAVDEAALPSRCDLVELAKHCEHRERDFAAALALVDRALRLCALAGEAGVEREVAAWQHRRRRLLRRIARERMAAVRQGAARRRSHQRP